MTEPRAKHQSIPSESTVDYVNYVRDQLLEISELIDSVAAYSKANNKLHGYIDDDNIMVAQTMAHATLVQLKDNLVKQIFGDRVDRMQTRKEFNAKQEADE